MDQKLQEIKAEGILDDPLRTECRKLLRENAALKEKCTAYQEENFRLQEAMKKKDEAAMRRLEAVRLEREAENLLKVTNSPQNGDALEDIPNDSYVGPVQALNDRDDDIYSVITTAIPTVATDDISSSRRSTESIESTERVEYELHDEPPRADSSVPRLPPRSISQSPVFRKTTTQVTQPARQEEEHKPKDGVFSRFPGFFRRTRKTFRLSNL